MQWGIFNDDSANWTEDEAVEAGFYSREEAERRLREIRKENGDDDDNCVVHVCEEPDDDDDDNDDAGEALAVGSVRDLPVDDARGCPWMVIRDGADVGYPSAVCVVPLSLTAVYGACDVSAPSGYWARCGWSLWVQKSTVLYRGRLLRSGWVSTAGECRSLLSTLVRGQPLPARETDDDWPAYQAEEERLAGEAHAVALAYG